MGLPPSSRWSDSTHQIETLEYLFAELATDEGISGLGYAYTIGFGGSAVLELMEQLAHRLVGLDHEAAAGRLAELLDWLHPIGQGGVTTLAVAAFDTAVWDLRAKAAGLPLHAFWGTRRADVLAYASGIDLRMPSWSGWWPATSRRGTRPSRSRSAGTTRVRTSPGCGPCASCSARAAC